MDHPQKSVVVRKAEILFTLIVLQYEWISAFRNSPEWQVLFVIDRLLGKKLTLVEVDGIPSGNQKWDYRPLGGFFYRQQSQTLQTQT